MKFIRWTAIILSAIWFISFILNYLLGGEVREDPYVLLFWWSILAIALYSEYKANGFEKHPVKHKTKERVVTDK
jgi:hypothetical protein